MLCHVFNRRLLHEVSRQISFRLRHYNRDYSDSEQPKLTYLTIYDAPYEMPDVAIEARLHPFCKRIPFKRPGCLQGYSDVLNGLRHYRVELRSSVPCNLRFGKFQLRFYHEGQTKTWRRCGCPDHIAKDCENSVCFNCDEIGHEARDCPHRMKCCICKSEAHKAIDCPLSWYGQPATYSEDGSSPEQPSAGRPDVNNLTDDNTQPETTLAEEDTPVTIVETDPLAPAILSKVPHQSIVNSQGLFNPTPQPSDLPERPMTVQPFSVFSTSQDIELSEGSDEMEDADEEDPHEYADSSLLQSPSLVSAAVKVTRKKIGHRNPARPLHLAPL